MKKIILLLLVFCLTLTFSKVKADDVEPSAYGIKIEDGWEFTKESFSQQYSVKVNGDKDYIIGIVSTDGFLFKLDDNFNSSSTYDYYLVSYRVSILPTVSKKKHDWFYNYYGWSECLNVSTTCSTDEKITNYSPITENPSASYDVGLSMGFSGKAAEASLVAEKCSTESSLKITAGNNPTTKKLNIKYDYLCDAAHNKSYLTSGTMQYGMYIVEIPKDKHFTSNLTVEMTFAVADGWSSFLQTYVGEGSRITDRNTYGLYN